MDFNEQQQHAIDSNERTILCLAGAGSGKTAVLVNRIARLVKDGCNPKSILALTFTNAASFEMGERYKNLMHCDDKSTPEFRTFHSFCYSLIVKDRALREQLGYTGIPSICTDAQVKEVEERCRLKLGYKKIPKDAVLTLKQKKEKEVLDKAIKKALILENLITFDILCYDVCELFAHNEEVVIKYKNWYKHVLCDEFQDTDARQYRFIASFPATTNIFLVGDALQCIYQFRGTTNEFIKALAANKDWEYIQLFKNYRCTRQICDYANKFSSRYAEKEYRIEMEGQRDGEAVETIHGGYTEFDGPPVSREHLEDIIKKITSSTIETAILCRSNKEVTYIKQQLSSRDIAFSSSSKAEEAMDILSSALDNNYLIDWVISSLDTNAYADYVRLSTIDPNFDRKQFIKQNATPMAQGRLDRVLHVRSLATDNSKSLEDRFNEISKYLKVKSKCKFNSETIKMPKDVITTIRNQLDQITDENLYVGTIHSSKGLEYERVLVVGVNGGLFKLGTEDMNNLFYVAVTRAKNYLTVYRR